MSQRPINLLEIKSNFHKAVTEACASFETIWNDLTGRVHNLNDQVKVNMLEIDGLRTENTRLQNEVKKLKGEEVTEEIKKD